jgi:O-antigen ligase
VLKTAFSSLRLTHISLALVGLMWVFPFLHVRHAYPLTTFYQEWWSALLGVLALLLLAERDNWVKPAIPKISLLPIGLIGVVLLQWLLGKIAYFDQAVLYALYMLFAALLMLLGARLRDCFGLLKLSQILAIALLIGAELNSLVGVLQHFSWHTLFDTVIAAKVSAVVYGNIAQPNHFANYIALGMISLGFLFQQNKLKAFHAALLAVPMLFVMTMSASRSSWLYLLLMAAMAWWWSQRDISLRPLLRYSLLLIVGFGLMHLIVHLQVIAVQANGIDTVQRLLDQEETGEIRLYLWREAGLMFMQSPFLGVGFGQFAWQHFQLVPELQQNNIVGLYNNAHNLIMQLAAEAGAAGLLILFISLGVWINGMRQSYAASNRASLMGDEQHRAALDAEHWWGYAILGVLAIHSLLEYPLWYAYFVAIAAILLGALDETRYRLAFRLVGRMVVVAVLLSGLLVLLQLMSGYKDLEQTLAGRSSATARMAGSSSVARDALVSLHGVSLLSPYTELFMSERIKIDEQYIKEKLALNTQVMRFVPIASVTYRQAFLLAQDGQQSQAQTILNQAIWSYPGSLPIQRQRLMELAVKDPVHFSALLEFAFQKEQEHASAIHNK